MSRKPQRKVIRDQKRWKPTARVQLDMLAINHYLELAEEQFHLSCQHCKEGDGAAALNSVELARTFYGLAQDYILATYADLGRNEWRKRIFARQLAAAQAEDELQLSWPVLNNLRDSIKALVAA